jgi:porphobilinogen synthase
MLETSSNLRAGCLKVAKFTLLWQVQRAESAHDVILLRACKAALHYKPLFEVWMLNSLDLTVRLRRNRKSAAIRNMLQETRLHPSDLIAPLFVMEGTCSSLPIHSMPGVCRWSLDLLMKKVDSLVTAGIEAIALFPTIDPMLRSASAEEAWNPNGLIPRAIQTLKAQFPHVCIFSDVALDPYTSHGHDGIVDESGEILNDETVQCLIEMALVHAGAGVDFIAPSDMMDGRVHAIRKALDDHGYSQVGILSYSAKYASSLYAPFRDALNVRLKFGDKKSYQLNPANRREAILESILDEEEGADILMVKPALFYLDVIANLRRETNRPIAAYHVSGEYAMVMAAAQAGYLNATDVFREALLSIKRAGADLIFTYATDLFLEDERVLI